MKHTLSATIALLVLWASLIACDSTLAQPPISTATELAIPATSTSIAAYEIGKGSSADVPDLQSPPLYPGAQVIKVESHKSPSWNDTTFRTPDSYEKVFAYYSEALAKEGWIITDTTRDGHSATYLWMDPTRKELQRFDLWISAEDLPRNETKVLLHESLWTNSSDIPTMVDAQQIEVVYTRAPGSGTLWESITTYTTFAKPQEVENYYRATLPGLGWIDNSTIGTPTPVSITSPDGITYIYIRDLGANGEDRGGSVVITAYADTSGHTHVKLDAIDTDIQPTLTSEGLK